jgi:hypothetical protein
LGRGSPNPHLGNTVADSDTGLLHVGARYDDPQVGRFISRDAVLSEHPYLIARMTRSITWIRVGILRWKHLSLTLSCSVVEAHCWEDYQAGQLEHWLQ